MMSREADGEAGAGEAPLVVVEKGVGMRSESVVCGCEVGHTIYCTTTASCMIELGSQHARLAAHMRQTPLYAMTLTTANNGLACDCPVQLPPNPAGACLTASAPAPALSAVRPAAASSLWLLGRAPLGARHALRHPAQSAAAPLRLHSAGAGPSTSPKTPARAAAPPANGPAWPMTQQVAATAACGAARRAG